MDCMHHYDINYYYEIIFEIIEHPKVGLHKAMHLRQLKEFNVHLVTQYKFQKVNE